MANKKISRTAAFLAIIMMSAACSSQPVKSETAARGAKDNETSEKYCSSTREYVTALEYIRAEKQMSVPEPKAREIASKVAVGCTGAAGRFIRVSHLLLKAGLTGRDATEKGLIFASHTDREVETFATVFQYSFLEDFLDLDLGASLNMALSLSTEFSGDTDLVKKDFITLVNFCTKKSSLDLPKPRCALMAARVAKLGQDFGGGVSKPFRETFEFLQAGTRGPGLPLSNALEVAEQVISFGPGAVENFMNGYRYALSEKGLGLGVQDALAFAKDMAQRNISVRAIASTKK